MKRFTVEVEGHCIDGDTFILYAENEKAAKEKALKKFENNCLHDFDFVETKIIPSKKTATRG